MPEPTKQDADDTMRCRQSVIETHPRLEPAPSEEPRTKRRLLKGPTAAERYTHGVVSSRTFYHLAETGRIPVIKLGKSIYFDADDIDAALEPERRNVG